MLRSNLLSVVTLAAASIGSWGLIAWPADEPPWPAEIAGFALSPLRPGQDPADGGYPSAAELDADLALLAKSGARSVRTYSIDGTLALVPELAARHGLDVTLGVWLDEDRNANAARLGRLKQVLAGAANVTRVVIGSEVLLRNDLPQAELEAILTAARRDLDVPIGTAEPWNLWLEHPELARHVDFVAVHLLPYWEGVDVDDAVAHVAAQIARLDAAFDAPLVIGEVGWPSFGRSRGRATASHAAAASFLRRFLVHADAAGYDYFLMEAFDQPWKRAGEGEVGAYWGVFDAERRPKYAAAGPVTPIPGALAFALGSTGLALAVFRLLVADGRRLRAAGRLFLAAVALLLATGMSWSAAAYVQQYWTPLDAMAAALVALGILGAALLIGVEAHEWAEARWALRGRGPAPRRDAPAGRTWPKVSIHVPAHAEPPEMLAQTLRAVAALDYPDFEVIVVDNNTADEALWRPVEACCARLGERFRFFHVAPLAGFKAGALNFALQHTASDAAIVAVVDSDYVVAPGWLKDLVPEFDAPRLAVVQAPQAYRDGGDSAFKKMCDAEYRGFFHIGMVTRNDRNAIIQHGTMTMIRRSVLDEIGGWAEWTITEDAELGLRVLERGYDTLYTKHCYGRGLTPDGFAAYKAQRHRWALGALQILKRHRRELLGGARTALTAGQRYHFVAGWLPWLAEGVSLALTAVALAWSALVVAAPDRFHPPVAVVSAFAIALFAFKLCKQACLYRTAVGATPREALGAIVAGLALTHVVGRAVIAGLVRTRASFYRTPKLAPRSSVAGAIEAALPETLLGAGLVAAALATAASADLPSIDRRMWCLLLVAFAVPHGAALAMALIGALPHARRRALAPRLAEVSDSPRG